MQIPICAEIHVVMISIIEATRHDAHTWDVVRQNAVRERRLNARIARTTRARYSLHGSWRPSCAGNRPPQQPEGFEQAKIIYTLLATILFD